MPTNKNVLKDREKYVGGSEISTILGINPYESRYELLLDKSGIKKNDFQGNDYTKYGEVIEGVIRNYINKEYGFNFIEYTIAKDYDDTIGDRCNYDGYDEPKEYTLEIKSTSHIYEDIKKYKKYIVQQLWGLILSPFKKSILAVYERDEDFKNKTPEQWVKDFDPNRLHIYKIHIDDYTDYVEEIENEVPKFKQDLKLLEENPLLSEEDLLPTPIQEISRKLEIVEKQMIAFKDLDKKEKELKAKLFEQMELNGIKSWETTDKKMLITRVDSTPDKTEMVFNEDKFKEEQPELYTGYCEEKIKKGKSGYVKITLRGD